MATNWVSPLVESVGGAAIAETQSIKWNEEEWTKLAAESALPTEAANAIRELKLVVGSAGIKRQDVRSVGAKCGDVGLFTASMIWGMKPGGYGPYRLREMLTKPRHGREPADVITEIVQTTRTHGAAEGFGSLWTNGSSRVFRLGTAFGTKVLHFAAARADGTPPEKFAEAPPLILDQFVYLGAQRLADVDEEFADSVPDPRKYMTRTLYEQYCRVMADRARTAGVTPDCLEMALFSLGKNPERFSVK